jgi:outer membrane receptor for ferrienterochelin and colicins
LPPGPKISTIERARQTPRLDGAWPHEAPIQPGGTLRRAAVVALILVAAAVNTAAASQGVSGVVLDSASGTALPGAVVRSGTAETLTDATGRFRLPVTGTLRVTRVGFRPLQLTGVAPDARYLRLLMVALPTPLEPVIVTVGREASDAFAAPASIDAIGHQEIASTSALSPVDRLGATRGFDIASKGLFQRTYAARGFLGAASDALLVLTDFRPAAVPSIRFNVPYLVPGTDTDLERIEFQRGPGAALYGPGSDRGILHFITRSPFDSRGTSLAVSAGSRELLDVSARWAGVRGNVGGRVSAAWRRGRDWPGGDTTEVFTRDPHAEAVMADARLDWRRQGGSEIVAGAGVASALSVADLTPAGAYQLRGWRTGYLQTRLRSGRGRTFANLVANFSHAGSTFNLHTGDTLSDHSRQVAAQVQRSLTIGGTRAHGRH